jgi:hypothetical protein
MDIKRSVAYRIDIFLGVLFHFDPLQGFLRASRNALRRRYVIRAVETVVALRRLVINYLRIDNTERACNGTGFAGGTLHGVPVEHTVWTLFQSCLRTRTDTRRLFASPANVLLPRQCEAPHIAFIRRVIVIAAERRTFPALIAFFKIDKEFFHADY